MGTTSFGLRYPASTATVDVSGDLQNLATDVNTNLDAIVAPGWTTYAPAWATSGVAPAIGNGTKTGRWRRVANDDLIHVQMKLIMGSTTTYGTNEWTLSLPATAHADDPLQGCGHIYDFGTFYRPFVTRKSSVTTVLIVAGTGGVGLVTNTAPHTWATSDELVLSLTYQPA